MHSPQHGGIVHRSPTASSMQGTIFKFPLKTRGSKMLTTFIHFQANYDYRGKLMINEDSNKGALCRILGGSA